jgi:DNA-binding CsgD family transcriptional regulator
MEHLTDIMQRHKEYLDTCTLSELDYAGVKAIGNSILRLSELENTTLAIYDTHRQNYLVTRWKFDHEILCQPEKGEELSPDFFWRLTHPDDLRFVMDAEVCAYQFICSLPVEERKDYKLVLDYRLKNRESHYIRFTKQSMVLEMDKYGAIWLVLVLFDLVSGEESKEQPHRMLVNIKTSKQYLLNDDDCSSGKLFTRREKEILQLLAQGLDSVDIAKRLFLSVCTVNNHRSNIMQKANAKNIAQALLYAKRLGMI